MSSARLRCSSSCKRFKVWVCMLGRNTSYVRLVFLAWYKVVPAFRRRSDGRAVSTLLKAIITLVERPTSCSPRTKRSRSTPRISFVTRSAVPASRKSWSKIVNSFPPKRAAIPRRDRRQLHIRRLPSSRILSPRCCPRLSFMTWKLSKSTKSTLTTLPTRSAVLSGCSKRPRNRTRFGRSLKGSCRQQEHRGQLCEERGVMTQGLECERRGGWGERFDSWKADGRTARGA